jgi:hypothetical protein
VRTLLKTAECSNLASCKALRFTERVDAGLADLPVHRGGCATDANRADALAFYRYRDTALDADEPPGADTESLSQHLMIGNLCAFPVCFTGSSRSERRATGFGQC